MDMDMACRKALPSMSCFYCGKPGHFSKDCLDHFDVQTFSVEDLKEILAIQIAEHDVALSESAQPTLEKSSSFHGGFSARWQVKCMPLPSAYNIFADLLVDNITEIDKSIEPIKDIP